MHRASRRRFLRLAGVGGLAGLAGCNGTGVSLDGDGGGGGGGNDAGDSDSGGDVGYLVYAGTLDAVARPFEQSATEVTQEMTERVASQTRDLAKTAVKGSSTDALQAILESVRVSFRNLYEGERAFALELVRAQAKAAAAASDRLPAYYENTLNDEPIGIGRRWNPDKPYYPLFAVLESDFRRLADADTAANRRVLRQHAAVVRTVFRVGLYVERVSNQDDYTGAKPLLQSLRFLRDTADWILEHIPAATTGTPTVSPTPAPARFTDDFSDGDLSEYVVLAGDRGDWTVEDAIDGPSAGASREEGRSILALDPDRHRFAGDRGVSVDALANTSNWKKNAHVFLVTESNLWRGRVAIQGDSISLVRRPRNGSDPERLAKQDVGVADGDVHRLTLGVRGQELVFDLDGEHRLSHTLDGTLPLGTVGFGNAGDIEHETWFDNLRAAEGDAVALL